MWQPATGGASTLISELNGRAAKFKLAQDLRTNWVSSPSTGGSEENRTPVQKFFHTGLSERSRLFTFPYKAVKRPTALLGSSYFVTAGGTTRCSCAPLIDALP